MLFSFDGFGNMADFVVEPALSFQLIFFRGLNVGTSVILELQCQSLGDKTDFTCRSKDPKWHAQCLTRGLAQHTSGISNFCSLCRYC